MTNETSLKQYEMDFPTEYIDEILIDMEKIMGIPVDFQEVKRARTNNGEISKECLCIFRSPEDQHCFILADCRNTGLLASIVVRCTIADSEKVHDKMLEWDTLMRKDYHQKTRDHLENRLMNEKNTLSYIMEDYKIKSLDEF